MVLGVIYTQFFSNPIAAIRGKLISYLLKISVIGLGFGMYLQETLNIGKEGFALTLITLLLTFGVGLILGKILKLDTKISHLISSGTAICGGSAIAAVAPVINANEKQISISLGVVFLLNSVALLIFPGIGFALNLTQHEFGLWAAIAIHDTSSVVGAALTYGDEALKIATTVKLGRALWIIPVTFASMLLFKGANSKAKIPWFIVLFVVAIVINSYVALPEIIGNSINLISKKLLVVTLFLVGTGLKAKALKEAGLKPMVLGVSIWLFISVVSLVLIQYFN
mgnify:CR=1 FL=1